MLGATAEGTSVIVEVVQALSSILIGCLVGLLAYLVPAALALGRPTMAAPRAVVRVRSTCAALFAVRSRSRPTISSRSRCWRRRGTC